MVAGRKPLPSSGTANATPLPTALVLPAPDPRMKYNPNVAIETRNGVWCAGTRDQPELHRSFGVDLLHRSPANSPAIAWRREFEDRTSHGSTGCPSPSAAKFDMHLQRERRSFACAGTAKARMSAGRLALSRRGPGVVDHCNGKLSRFVNVLQGLVHDHQTVGVCLQLNNLVMHIASLSNGSDRLVNQDSQSARLLGQR